MELLKSKVLQVLTITAFFLGGMWVMYFINNILFNGALSFGVHPRSVGVKEFFGMNFSWIFHGGINHIVGNSLALVTMIPMIATFERRPWIVLWSLVFISGFMTWCLGSANSNHIGASGLIFAIMGYVFTVAIFAKKYQYWIPIILSGGGYWFSIKTGLVPQEGVSFAGHFGGLVGGIILGLLMAYDNKDVDPNIIKTNLKYSVPKPVDWSTMTVKVYGKKWYQFWK